MNFRRLRNIKPDESIYQLNLDTLQISEHSLEANLINTAAPTANFKFSLIALADNSFRILVDEINPLHPRYHVRESLAGEPKVIR